MHASSVPRRKSSVAFPCRVVKLVDGVSQAFWHQAARSARWSGRYGGRRAPLRRTLLSRWRLCQGAYAEECEGRHGCAPPAGWVFACPRIRWRIPKASLCPDNCVGKRRKQRRSGRSVSWVLSACLLTFVRRWHSANVARLIHGCRATRATMFALGFCAERNSPSTIDASPYSHLIPDIDVSLYIFTTSKIRRTQKNRCSLRYCKRSLGHVLIISKLDNFMGADILAILAKTWSVTYCLERVMAGGRPRRIS